jgi:TPP-dependent pyruvate/acetoin dehydrogenase alpha subunit
MKQQDCISRFEQRVLSEGTLDQESLHAARAEAERRVAEAVAFAEVAPWPVPEAYTEDVYVRY